MFLNKKNPKTTPIILSTKLSGVVVMDLSPARPGRPVHPRRLGPRHGPVVPYLVPGGARHSSEKIKMV